jgi:hypothetical protein
MDPSVFLRQVQGRSWYRGDLTRSSAESYLQPFDAGAFVVRPSTQANAIALSFKQENGAIGHNTIVAVHDASRVPSLAFRLTNCMRRNDCFSNLMLFFFFFL